MKSTAGNHNDTVTTCIGYNLEPFENQSCAVTKFI
ncbi:hypothetical protein SAMN05216295_12216 [Pseudomonas luteola]|nr:hypothetical protein SAMN05216295_12216 [Pseudomonas zeshuii]